MASKVAELYLSPPATSVDVERLFSTAGDIRTQERNSLLPENAAKLLFLKENLPRIGFNYESLAFSNKKLKIYGLKNIQGSARGSVRFG